MRARWEQGPLGDPVEVTKTVSLKQAEADCGDE